MRETRRRTNERNRERELALVPARQLAREAVRIHVEPRRGHDRVHVPRRLRAPAQALEPRVDVQVLAHGELRVDRGELRAHSERKAGVLRVPDDGAAVDEDLPSVGEEVAACRMGRVDRQRL